MNFDYLARIQRESSIDIENIGNCALDVYNDLGFEWLLIIHTKEGQTEMIEYGPLLPDLNYPPAKVNYSYERIDFAEGKIVNKITKFLNDSYRNITQAFEIEKEEAMSKMKSLVDFICL